MEKKELLKNLYFDADAVGGHLMTCFRLPNDRSLCEVLGQPDQPDNQTALACWVAHQLFVDDLDPRRTLVDLVTERLAELLIDHEPHRWAEITAGWMRTDEVPLDSVPDITALESLRNDPCAVTESWRWWELASEKDL